MLGNLITAHRGAAGPQINAEATIGIVATVASTAIAGITSGNLGAALRAGLITAITVGVMNMAMDTANAMSSAANASASPSWQGPSYCGCSTVQLPEVQVTANDPVVNPMAGGAAGASATASASLVIGAMMSVVPGAHLTSQATQSFRQRQYISGTVYLSASLIDSGMAIATLGMSLRIAAATRASMHHIMTNKNWISSQRGGPWSPKFADMAKEAGMTLDDAANLVKVPGHRGPHPAAYHQVVDDRLATATTGLQGAEYSAAFRAELDPVGKEVAQSGTYLNKLVTGQ
ncbi:MAG: AHH domain-containing protein [Hyphomicrobiaceae bacterium]|nr:AHH domain-containing protein [Hyphomicrobiaceae bacterium]